VKSQNTVALNCWLIYWGCQWDSDDTDDIDDKKKTDIENHTIESGYMPIVFFKTSSHSN
jgi:hypothetical protein